MNLTLHLTENCNMDCDYCIRDKKARDMSDEVVKAACDMIFKDSKSAGLSFFGGEPLLKKELIYYALDICEKKSKETGIPFACKMTTNGILLDDDFLARAKRVGMGIGLSFEGLAQNTCRHMADGSDSLELVRPQAEKLLGAMPKSYAMMTIAPQAATDFAKSVKYIYDMGFRRITATIAYGKRVNWTDETMNIVEEQLKLIADFYIECYKRGDKFFFSPFDGKISDAMRGKNASDRCHLGLRQMPVAPDGKLFACTQFIGDEEYCLGDVFNGLDKNRQIALARKSLEKTEPKDCIECELRNRCTHTCGCSNRMETGNENEVSAVQCTYEKLVIFTADEVAETLYEYDKKGFEKIFG